MATLVLFAASMLTTAMVSVWLTAVVSVAIKNRLMERQLKQLQYWQARAMKMEDPNWRQ